MLMWDGSSYVNRLLASYCVELYGEGLAVLLNVLVLWSRCDGLLHLCIPACALNTKEGFS